MLVKIHHPCPRNLSKSCWQTEAETVNKWMMKDLGDTVMRVISEMKILHDAGVQRTIRQVMVAFPYRIEEVS